MENANTLSHLLQVEAQAAALVKDAQEEADRRVNEAEEKNRINYEEQYKVELEIQKNSLLKSNTNIKKQYKEALNNYCAEISGVYADNDKFCMLLNEYLENK